jgi:hypothetical protein
MKRIGLKQADSCSKYDPPGQGGGADDTS